MDKGVKKKNNLYNIKHELIGRYSVTTFGVFLVLLTLCIVAFIVFQGLATFYQSHRSPAEFLFSTVWKPDRDISEGGPSIGSLIFITGSVIVCMISILISTPFSLSTSIFMTEISPKFGEKILRPAIEIFVGIPSVVYGWIGLSVLVPFIRKYIGGLGFSVLAASLVLAIMIFPTIASVASDALRAVSKDFREASYALGATRWQTIRKVVIPAALPGILTGIVLGMARAFGEALAVQMVLGNSIRIPGSLLDSTVNLTSIITMDMGNSAEGTEWYNALWSMALILLTMSFIFIVLIRMLAGRRAVKQ